MDIKNLTEKEREALLNKLQAEKKKRLVSNHFRDNMNRQILEKSSSHKYSPSLN